MAEDKIKYSDLISPDGSIEALIRQLEELNSTYSETLSVIKAGAKEMIAQLKSMNSSTEKSRAEIDEAAIAADRLARAQKELKFAMSDTGKEVAWLKSQTISQNKMTVEQKQRSEALIGSYNKLKIQVKDLTDRYKELSAADREGSKGERLLSQLLSKKAQLAELDSQMKLHVESLSAVEKAEQKLAYLRSDEGKRLLELKQQIREITDSYRKQKPTVDEVTQAINRLREAQSATRETVNRINLDIKEANKVSKLRAQLARSEEGSYNALAAQYELNKIKLNAMSAAERNAVDSGKKLEAETLALYMQMIKLQEATGNHRLSVGNYAKSWDGLGISVSQVIRELPAAAVSLNTFFLGISNNIPILMDEIQKLREENKRAVAEGKQTRSVIGSITRAIFSWNTALVVLLTVFSMHGKAIIEWIGTIFKGQQAAQSYVDSLEDINEAMEKTNGSYGQNVVSLRKLSNEWKELTSQKDKLQFIKDNKSEFDKLDISIRNVNDAENILVKHTDDVTLALQARAKAAAAMKLAADKYEEALIKQNEAETKEIKLQKEGPTLGQRMWARFAGRGHSVGNQSWQSDPEETVKDEIYNLRNLSKTLTEEGDAFFKIADTENKRAAAILKKAGIEEAHKYGKEHIEREKRQRDLTDTIWRNDLTIRKKYELSISALQRDEFQKRRIETIDATNATIREMQEKFRKNQAYLENKDGRFKPLTSEQRKQIEEQQNEINAIIENSRRKLEIDLQKIDDEQQVDSMKKLREMMDGRLSIITQDLEKEKQLRLQQLDNLEAMYATKAQTSDGGEIEVTAQRRTPEQIAEFHRRRKEIEAEYDAIIYRLREQSIENEIELVKKGTIEEIDLLLQRNEIARRLALAENTLKPASERQSEDQINAIYDKRRLNIYGSQKMTNFDQAQKQAEAEFNIVKRNERQITIFKLQQERDRWKKQIELAKQGAIDWSDAQLAEAEAMVKKLERELAEAQNPLKLIADKGIEGGLLTMLGFDDDQIAAFTDAVGIILDNLKAIADAEVQLAEIQVQKAQERVSAAKEAYDAEVEARNNGYANNVATSKKELQLEKKNQLQKEKLLEEARRRQEYINTVIQASSLVTASANIWSAFSAAGIAGPALAIAAIAAMWASFAAAKIKAAQVTREKSYEYGEGGLEFLNGGSHASGNDIDLHTKNSKGQNMRAEGGEAMAIINKRSTKKYKRILPSLVDSLNKGIFEDKYLEAFKSGDNFQSVILDDKLDIDLSQLENDVKTLKENSERQIFVFPDGSYIEKRKNVTRKIKLL